MLAIQGLRQAPVAEDLRRPRSLRALGEGEPGGGAVASAHGIRTPCRPARLSSWIHEDIKDRPLYEVEEKINFEVPGER